jgi:hypothetical protein
MPVYSANGYTANDRSVIASFTIPGTTRKVSLRKGDTSVILLNFFAWFHVNIEPIDVGVFDDWGYAERTIRGSSTTLSTHASGTSGDLNATKHPLGKRNTFSADQARRIRDRLRYYEGCIRWGGDYENRADEMHFEINRGAADCKRVADKIRAAAAVVATPVPPPATVARPTIQRGSKGEAVALIQRFLGVKPADGDFGPITEAAVKSYQRMKGLTPDGIVGSATWAATQLR